MGFLDQYTTNAQSLPNLQQSAAGVNVAPSYDFSGWNGISSYIGDLFKSGSDANVSAFGGTQNGITSNGWAGTALGAVGQGMNLWSGMQQLDLAKDQLAFQKDAFNKNWNAQRTTTNTALADRQNARLGANPTGYESLSSYMAKNGI